MSHDIAARKWAGHWFERLLSKSGSDRPYAIIYTSDHGQNIVNDGTFTTHCRPAAVRFEGVVPMIVFSNDAEVLHKLKEVQLDMLNHTSHFQIFPTLLGLADYKDTWIRERYGDSLADRPATPPAFFVGDIYGLGSVRRWLSIYAVRDETVQGDPHYSHGPNRN